MPVADQFGIDLGNVLASAEQIRGARINNALAGNALDQQVAAQGARQTALAGNSSPLAALAAIDPAQAGQLQSFISAMADDERQALAESTEQIGKLAAYVKTSDDPEKAYQQVLGAITDPKVRGAMPQAYDEDWVDMQLAQAQTIDQILQSNAAAGTVEPVEINGQLVNPANGEVIGDYRDAATGAGEATPDIQEYEYAKKEGFQGTFAEWQNAKSSGMSLSVDPATGAVSFVQGPGAAGAMPKLSETTSKDVNFLTRSTAANTTLEGIDTELTNLAARAANADPTGLARSWMQSDNFQKAEQAALEFKTAILRKDTGAAITEGEDRLYDRLYIPQPGDSTALIEQKRTARTRAVAALEAGIPSEAIAALEEKGLLGDVIETASEAPAADTAPADSAAAPATAEPDLSGPPTRVVNGVEYWNVNGEWYTK